MKTRDDSDDLEKVEGGRMKGAEMQRKIEELDSSFRMIYCCSGLKYRVQ